LISDGKVNTIFCHYAAEAKFSLMEKETGGDIATGEVFRWILRGGFPGAFTANRVFCKPFFVK
jgi:hypothetical protein